MNDNYKPVKAMNDNELKQELRDARWEYNFLVMKNEKRIRDYMKGVL